MSYIKKRNDKYEEQKINLVHEINWKESENDNLAVYQKVNQWLMLHEKVQSETKSTNFQSLDTFSTNISISPVFKNEHIHDKISSEVVDNNYLKYLKTPCTKSNKEYLSNASTSPIVQKTSFLLRKRKLFENNETKDEVSSQNSGFNSQNNNNNSYTEYAQKRNSSSPIMISKRYLFRKKEKSIVIKDEIFSQVSDTIPFKIEDVEYSPNKKNNGFNFLPDIQCSPVTISSTQQIDLVDSEDEGTVIEKKNMLIENATFSMEKSLCDMIEEQYTQEINENLRKNVDISSSHVTEDSDETYCSIAEKRGGLINSKQSSTIEIETISLEKQNPETSQRISQASTFSAVGNTIINSSRILNLRNSTAGIGMKLDYSSISINRRKKKIQKNSLLDKLHNLVATAASFNRLWRHQITQSRFQEIYKQFVLLEVQNTYPFNGRQIFQCLIINDKNNLLNSFSNSTTQDINVIVIPEIVGNIFIPHQSCMKLYPPWKIINVETRLVEASQFIFDSNSDAVNIKNKKAKSNKDITKFDCPCLENNKISNVCDMKFKNYKSSIVDELFKS